MNKMYLCAAILVLSGCSQDASSAGDGAANARANAAGDQTQTVSMADQGRRQFNECAVCHTVNNGEAHRVGPNLFGIVGAEAGKQDGFAYSRAMAQSGVLWSDDNLDAFIENPQGFMRGNRMAYIGQRDAAKRAALIAYLKTLNPDAD
ncbi:c-type cytochrome [Hyphococcus sp.]|uniref:c-type cytochrome n=1 Tax=Hyphococcus sp. TaxID=2038636 RepID=UPI003CCBDD36